MSTRRQKKVGSFVKRVVSDIIVKRLSDPRIKGIISVTRVEATPDLKEARVYISVMSATDKQEQSTFFAVKHAKGKIQAILGEQMTGRYCPKLSFHLDKQYKKAMETINIIDQLSEQRNSEDSSE
jgi:ribosome-binding factor A